MKSIIIIVILILLLLGFYIWQDSRKIDLPEGEAQPVQTQTPTESTTQANTNNTTTQAQTSSRQILETDGTLHSIPLGEIKQGCFGRDCIPSVDDPRFVSVAQADKLFEDANENEEEVLGIGLNLNDEKRFYPFNMLVTREIVNDVIGGQPVIVTYCPLCGTGIVFDRTIDGQVFEFGISGFLWQSNLLMYNRGTDEDQITLWSQVLGEGVVGPFTGTKLEIINSDIVFYSDWKAIHPDTVVLDAGRIGDPYGGDYYGTAKFFDPDFDEANSPLDPSEYVVGIEIDGKYKAYKLDEFEITDTFNGRTLDIDVSLAGEVDIVDRATGETIPHVTGFWFSWVAAHPETELHNQ